MIIARNRAIGLVKAGKAEELGIVNDPERGKMIIVNRLDVREGRVDHYYPTNADLDRIEQRETA